MNNKLKLDLKSYISIGLSILITLLFVTVSVQGATTISTNISTGGTLSVTGASTLTGLTSMIQATSTRFSVVDTAYFGGTATSTFSSTGALTLATDLTLENAETISNSTDGTITLGSNVMKLVGTASTSAIKVGDEANASTVNGLVFGFCTIADTTVTASSTNYANCASATGVVLGDRVFVQATSSLPENFLIQAASSTAADTINVRIYNNGQISGNSTGVNSFNFWAVR